jgi:hypothetical protein
MISAKVVVFLGAASLAAFANNLVAPNSDANVAGNSSNALPGSTAISVEYQELVGGGQMPLNPVQIYRFPRRTRQRRDQWKNRKPDGDSLNQLEVPEFSQRNGPDEFDLRR